ncbi:MAG: sulfite exporter TauE/SafE family protein [Acidimicrobiales bacterium]
MHWIAIALIGAGVGYLGGLFGKGGSAIATPMLAAIGVPAIVAVASPLPATVPGTLVAYRRYHDSGITNPRVVRWSIAFGIPATALGALATRWIGGGFLVKLTDIIIAIIGLRVVLRPEDHEGAHHDMSQHTGRLVSIAVVVGLLSGLLANAGGFLLVPLYLEALRLPIKTALACSLAVASVLALPGTVVHAALGHIDWAVTAVFAAASIPLSSLGAKTALRMQSAHLERVYGAGLLVLGVTFFFLR